MLHDDAVLTQRCYQGLVATLTKRCVDAVTKPVAPQIARDPPQELPFWVGDHDDVGVARPAVAIHDAKDRGHCPNVLS
ncbi:MAG TPA: hypothetical protein VHW04_18950 [Solirubrobacteraceae bacterium]|nr:hypothetical protein [Solirubrobacteraceae bacterium]